MECAVIDGLARRWRREIFVLGRRSPRQALSERIEDLAEDCAAHAGLGPGALPLVRRFLGERIRCVERELDREDLGLAPAALHVHAAVILGASPQPARRAGAGGAGRVRAAGITPDG